MIKTVFVRASALMAWLLGIREEIPGQRFAADGFQQSGFRPAEKTACQIKPKPNRVLEYTTPSGHHYVWLYRGEFRREILKEITSLAGSTKSDFDYHDAAIVCEQVRAMDP